MTLFDEVVMRWGWMSVVAVIVFAAIAVATAPKKETHACPPGEKLTTAYVYVGGNEIVVELCMKNDL